MKRSSDQMENPFFRKGEKNTSNQGKNKSEPSASQGRSNSPDIEIIEENKPPSGSGPSVSGSAKSSKKSEPVLVPKYPPLRPEFYILSAFKPITSTSGKSASKGKQNEERPGEACRKRRKPGPKCFNCSGPHLLDDCDLDHDPLEIAKNSRMYKTNQQRDRPPTPVRYTDDGVSPEDQGIVPGEISSKLRKALDVGRYELPRFVYKMREFGYPPGHLEKAKVYSSGLNMFDGSTNNYDWREPEVISVDERRLYVYPGFNGPMPPGVSDEYAKYRAPKYNPLQNIDLYHQELNELYASMRREKEREAKKMAQDASSDAETDFPESEQRRTSSKRARMELNMSTTNIPERPDSSNRSSADSIHTASSSSPFRDYSMVLFNPCSQTQESGRRSADIDMRQPMIGPHGEDLSDRFLPNPVFGLGTKLPSPVKHVAVDYIAEGYAMKKPVKQPHKRSVSPSLISGGTILDNSSGSIRRARQAARNAAKRTHDSDVIILEDDDGENESLPRPKKVRFSEPKSQGFEASSSSDRLVIDLDWVRPPSSKEANSQDSQNLSGEDVSPMKPKRKNISKSNSVETETSSIHDGDDGLYDNIITKELGESPEKATTVEQKNSQGNSQKSEGSSGYDRLYIDTGSDKQSPVKRKEQSTCQNSETSSSTDKLDTDLDAIVVSNPEAKSQESGGTAAVLSSDAVEKEIGPEIDVSQEETTESELQTEISQVMTIDSQAMDYSEGENSQEDPDGNADGDLVFDPYTSVVGDKSDLEQKGDTNEDDDKVDSEVIRETADSPASPDKDSFIIDISGDVLDPKIVSVCNLLEKLDDVKKLDKPANVDKEEEKSPRKEEEDGEDYTNPFSEFPSIEKFADGMDDLLLHDVEPQTGRLGKVLNVIRQSRRSLKPIIEEPEPEPEIPGE